MTEGISLFDVELFLQNKDLVMKAMAYVAINSRGDFAERCQKFHSQIKEGATYISPSRRKEIEML